MKRLVLFSILIAALAVNAQEFRPSEEMKLSLDSMSNVKNGPDKKDRIFKPLETVWVNLKIAGLKKDAKQNVSFQADLRMTGKKGRVVLDKKNILAQKLYGGDFEFVLQTTFQIDLYEKIQTEEYTVTITVRDMNDQKFATFTTNFTVAR